MKIIVSFLSVVIGIFIFTSCDESTTIENGSLVPARFEKPYNNTSFTRGDKISLQVIIANKSTVEHIKIFTSDTIIYEGKTTQDTYSFLVPTQDWKIGVTQFSIETKTKDGQQHNAHRIVRLLPSKKPQEFSLKVMKTYPHSVTSFTQGLEFNDGDLYEGTGGRQNRTGTSMLAKVDIETGEFLKKTVLDKKYFGEGVTILHQNIYQLTWQENTCFVYDKATFEEIKTFTYSGEGWGLCNDGTHLIMSDGSERIYFRDPSSFSIVKTIDVYMPKGKIKGLNELEYIKGMIYANVYTTSKIAIIDPETGIVTGLIDAGSLAQEYRGNGEVLNGIAYDKRNDKLYITGKNWPYLLEVELIATANKPI